MEKNSLPNLLNFSEHAIHYTLYLFVIFRRTNTIATSDKFTIIISKNGQRTFTQGMHFYLNFWLTSCNVNPKLGIGIQGDGVLYKIETQNHQLLYIAGSYFCVMSSLFSSARIRNGSKVIILQNTRFQTWIKKFVNSNFNSNFNWKITLQKSRDDKYFGPFHCILKRNLR